MDLNKLEKMIKTHVPKPEGKYKTFSVLAPLIKVNNELHLLFEIRSENLNNQPGEICFPGGKIEKGETSVQCAIRETCEELNIPTNSISIFGALDFLVLPYNFIIYPFLGVLEGISIDSIDYSKDEVAGIFSVPLDFFIQTPPKCHPIELKTLTDENFPYHLVVEDGEDYDWRSGKYPVYFYIYNDYVIWGMTARIIKNFVDIIENNC